MALLELYCIRMIKLVTLRAIYTVYTVRLFNIYIYTTACISYSVHLTRKKGIKSFFMLTYGRADRFIQIQIYETSIPEEKYGNDGARRARGCVRMHVNRTYAHEPYIQVRMYAEREA